MEPTVVAVGTESHEFTPAVPLTDHNGDPDGAVAPAGPVTVNVNTAVPVSVPSPIPTRVAVGVTGNIVTEAGAVVGSAVKLLSPEYVAVTV